MVVLSRTPTVEAAVAAMRAGAADYLREPCSAEELRAALQRAGEAAAVAAAAPPATPSRSSPRASRGCSASCPAMREVFALIQRIAPTDSTVLVSGESGTGKEMVVRAIHRHSRRRDYPLLACDCTALAPTLLESELFGHVKGSFSGAIATKQGLFEVAHQGTLFLDEVANLSMETQGKLLRVLETRQRPQGGRHGRTRGRHPADRHHQPQPGRDGQGRGVPGRPLLPAERRADRAAAAARTAGRHPAVGRLLPASSSRGRWAWRSKGFSSEAMRQMEIYAWPGNVRELRNIVERLAVLYGGARIEL